MNTNPRPRDPDKMSLDQFMELNLMQSGWLSFIKQSHARSFDTADHKLQDAFYCGAALIVEMLSSLARDGIDDIVRREVCGKLDDEIADFNRTSGYQIHFRPHL